MRNTMPGPHNTSNISCGTVWERCDSSHDAIMLPHNVCIVITVLENVLGKSCGIEDIVYGHANAKDVALEYQKRGWLVQRIGNVVRLVRRPL